MLSDQIEPKNFDRNFEKSKKAAIYGPESVLLDETRGVRLALAGSFIYDQLDDNFFGLLIHTLAVGYSNFLKLRCLEYP